MEYPPDQSPPPERPPLTGANRRTIAYELEDYLAVHADLLRVRLDQKAAIEPSGVPFIIIGERSRDGGHGVSVFYGRDGLQEATWGPGEKGRPALTPAPSLRAVDAFERYRGQDPRDLIAWLEAQLARIDQLHQAYGGPSGEHPL